MLTKFFVPSLGPCSWKPLLARPNEQWKEGFSAKMLADLWENAGDFPQTFKSVLENVIPSLNLIIALPEYQVELNSPEYPSQCDLLVLARNSNGLVAISVEGKVNEHFGDTVEIWNKDNKPTRNERFDFLRNKLDLKGGQVNYGDIRYQLFHRTVSAILMAEKLHAKGAMMVVHSFSKTDNHFDDYAKFVRLFDNALKPAVNQILKVKTLQSGIDLFLGWVKN